MPARVQEDDDFQPAAVSMEGKTHAVHSIAERVEEGGGVLESGAGVQDALPGDAGGWAGVGDNQEHDVNGG